MEHISVEKPWPAIFSLFKAIFLRLLALRGKRIRWTWGMRVGDEGERPIDDEDCGGSVGGAKYSYEYVRIRNFGETFSLLRQWDAGLE